MRTTWLCPAAVAGALLVATLGCAHTPAQSTEPADTVAAVAAAERRSYTGQCPLVADRAPAFHAIITVAGGPTTVTYQWVNTADPHPATQELSFPGGGRQHAVVSYTESRYDPDRTRTGWITLKIVTPRAVSTDPMPYTISCHTGTPHRYDPGTA
jgi:eukaryotic-like serine/threonine-protein kinase